MNRIKNIPPLLICLSLFLFPNQTFPQEKVDITLGIGFPKFMNAGIRYQLNQTQLGFSIGSIPLKDETIISINSGVQYHFAGTSELSDRRPWYVGSGLNYIYDESESIIEKNLYLIIEVGWDINFTKKFGMDAYIGAGLLLFEKRVRKTPPGWFNFEIKLPVIPTIGVSAFYRI